MSREQRIALIAAAFFSVFVAGLYVVFTVRKRNGKGWRLDGRKYGPILNWMFLPGFLLFSLLFPILWMPGLRAPDLGRYISHSLQIILSLFFVFSFYYAVLLLALPVLRRYVMAATVASLWLVPTYLYLLLSHNGNVFFPRRALWHIPFSAAKLVFLLWIAVFLLIFGWKIAEHLRFRRDLLKHSRLPAAEALAIWEQVCEELGETHVDRLVISARTTTPLSVGVWSSSAVVVLPEKNYSPEELRLILRHELIHIQQEDAGIKVFLTMSAAIAWFNPFVWIAMRRAAEDLELSCDETVLLRELPESRRRYAELILKTAADQRGFTTCLCSSAKSLRYRLKSVLEERRKRIGALLLAVCLFGLFFTYGWPGISVSEGTFGTRIYENSIGKGISFMAQHLDAVSLDNAPATCADPEAFLESLQAQELYPVNSLTVAEEKESEHELSLHFSFSTSLREDYYVDLVLTDDAVSVVKELPEGFSFRTYELARPVDWNSIRESLTAE